jgi:hypothetical protein
MPGDSDGKSRKAGACEQDHAIVLLRSLVCSHVPKLLFLFPNPLKSSMEEKSKLRNIEFSIPFDLIRHFDLESGA